MTKIYDDSYTENPIAEFAFNKKSLLLSPSIIIGGVLTFGIYIFWALVKTLELSQQKYIVYPQYIKHIDGSKGKRQYNYQFDQIERVDVRYTFFDRIFGTGTIVIKLKGFKLFSAVYMIKIADVDRAVELLNTAIQRHKERTGVR